MAKRSSAARDYFDLLDAIHKTVKPRTYVEIGVASGKSLSLALPGTMIVGIDPAADIRHPVSGELHIFRMTSDAFFASSTSVLFGGTTIDMAFIDGLHHSDAVLRDFRHLEAASSSGSLILIHDCVPPNAIAASRDRTTMIWAGDVWKAIVALRLHRPELNVTVVDVAPTGLAIVSGLQPKSRVLFDDYDRIVRDLGSIPVPETPDEWKAAVGATSYDWNSIRRRLPSQPFRTGSTADLVRRRAMRRPTLAHVTWQVRRFIGNSAVGRTRRRFSENVRWKGLGP